MKYSQHSSVHAASCLVCTDSHVWQRCPRGGRKGGFRAEDGRGVPHLAKASKWGGQWRAVARFRFVRFKVKAVSAKQEQLSRTKASIEVQTSNQQVARVDSRLPIAGALTPWVGTGSHLW